MEFATVVASLHRFSHEKRSKELRYQHLRAQPIRGLFPEEFRCCWLLAAGVSYDLWSGMTIFREQVNREWVSRRYSRGWHRLKFEPTLSQPKSGS